MFAGHLLATAIGIILGVALVWWVRPDTGAGTALIVVIAVIVCFVTRSVILAMVGLFRKYGASSRAGKSP
jgi:hypothetical protein